MTGVKVGNWILGPELGRGVLGTTYRATSEDGTRFAAVKLLSLESTRSLEFQSRFAREMLALQRLQHPNIARFYDSGVHAGLPYYASELVEGEDGLKLLKTHRKPDETGLSWKELVISICVQACRALKHGHHRSILHRELKPTNLILSTDGVLKLTDFGVAKIIGQSALVLAPEATGTIGCLAPEFFTGKPVTRRSDFYALGCTLYILLTGRPPFTANSASEFMHKHCYVLPDRPIQFVPKIPTDFDDLLCSLVEKNPTRRPATAAAILEELDQLRGKCERKGETVTWPNPDGDTSATQVPIGEDGESTREEYTRPRPLMRQPWVVVPLALLVLGVILFLLFRPRPSAEELYERAQPLLKSDNPDDWDRAWDEYLQPLADRYPERFKDELRELRELTRDRKRLRTAITEGEKKKPGSEAERLYFRGLAFANIGDFTSARRVWSGLEQASHGASDQRWLMLAKDGLAEMNRRSASNPTPSPTASGAIQAELERIRELREAGKKDEADARLARLRTLYEDDPASRDLVRE